MTKHYAAAKPTKVVQVHTDTIAEIIRNAGYKWLYRKRISTDLANYFKQDNPRFNQQKFLDACDID